MVGPSAPTAANVTTLLGPRCQDPQPLGPGSSRKLSNKQGLQFLAFSLPQPFFPGLYSWVCLSLSLTLVGSSHLSYPGLLMINITSKQEKTFGGF